MRYFILVAVFCLMASICWGEDDFVMGSHGWAKGTVVEETCYYENIGNTSPVCVSEVVDIKIQVEELPTITGVEEKEVTEWKTTSHTYPVDDCPLCATVTSIYRPIMCNQVGTIYKIMVALIKWKDEVIEAELERVVVDRTYRSIDCKNNLAIDLEAE